MDKGQAIVEILVALGIAVVVIIALVSLVVTSVANVTFSRTQGEATRVAREAMEWIRSERDRDWDAFLGRAGGGTKTYCLSTLSTWPAPGTCTPSATVPNTSLRREAVIKQISTTEIEVGLRVFWKDSKGDHEVRLNSRFTKWR